MTALQPSTSPSKTLYDTDYVKWVTITVEQLRQEAYAQVDWVNLLDEIEDMARRERQALKSNLRILLLHLLKWQYPPSKRTRSWASSIIEHRERVYEVLEASPSLKPDLETVLSKAYPTAAKRAVTETMLPAKTFPDECPFTVAQIMDENFPPEMIQE
ncbi:MAG: DUF29 domain-containing protein [Cyanobacteria bacterium J06648_16]